MINNEFNILYQVRFETLQYAVPEFTTISENPLEINFKGGAIGIHSTYFNDDVSKSISCKCNIQSPHYFLTGSTWQYVNTSRTYSLHDFQYIWFASFNSNTFNLTEIEYA